VGKFINRRRFYLWNGISRLAERLGTARVWAAVLVLSTWSGLALADDLIGQASVIDGDTIEIHGTRIRLWGIDAPEGTQLCRNEESDLYQCGKTAATALAGLFYTIHRPVTCLPTGHDQYGRTVAMCSLGTPGPDIGQWLVANGYALDWPQYSRGRYSGAQQQAKQAGRGIWKGSYVEPWLYRVCIRDGGRPQGCSDDTNAHP
jgi:endonuclease YncB( thermonuclease family)